MAQNFKETAYNYFSDHPCAYFSSDERKWINKITKLAASHPGEVQIIKHPEENGGAIYCRLPKSWLKISPTRKRELTEEQKAILTERMRQARECQKP